MTMQKHGWEDRQMTHGSGNWTSMRWAAVLATLIALIGCTPRNDAPPPSATSPQALLDDARSLDRAVEKLYAEAKFDEAVPLAERSLALRAQALGPLHPDVAESLNNLAVLYQAQGNDARAEPFFVQALELTEQAVGPLHLDVALSLNNLANLYIARGAYARAEPLHVRALGIREKLLGSMHPDVAQSLSNLAEIYRTQGAYARAIPLHTRALDIREQALGPLHSDVALSLNNLAELYKAQGTYTRAQPLHVRALDIREKVLGPLHPDVAHSLNNLAVIYQHQGAYARAEPLFARSLRIQEKALGPEHPNVAFSLNNLANLYRSQGRYAPAEPLYLRALQIWETTRGPRDPVVATSLNNLAALYRDQGAYGRAEPLYLRALDITENALGAMHPEMAISLCNLAGLYQAQGANARAEPLYLRALDIAEKALGPIHPAVATILANRAGLYRDQGAYSRAEPLYLRALDIAEKALGPVHPDVAINLNNLALLYESQAVYARAEPLHLRALEITEKTLGARHPDVAISLHNLAVLYQRQGADTRAEPLFLRALDIREQALGPMHPGVATGLSSLAWLYWARGEYGKAEPLFLRALDIREQIVGPMHPDVATSLNNLALLYTARGTHARAERLLARAAEIREAHLRNEIAPLSEPRKHALMTLLQEETEIIISLHAHSIPSSSHALELALATVLRRKGRVLDSLADHRGSLRTHLTPQLGDKLSKLAEANTELSTLLRAFDPGDAQYRAARISTLRTHIDDLESALSTASVEFRAQSEPVAVAKVQEALPRGAALVELVRYHRFDARQGQSPRREARYVAYILPWRGPPQWISLGEAAPIDARVDAMLDAMREGSGATTARMALRHLDALIYAPIRARLAGISHVILSPDGKLNLVPFEALVDPQGRYELEHRLVSYVTSGRDLLRLAVRQAPRSPATIIADPDYGSGTRFGRIAGAGAEADEIRLRLPGAKVLTGAQATKAALAAVKGPAVLHVATHGFFAREGATPAAHVPHSLERGMSVDRTIPPPPTEYPADALDRAGLALAGANVRPDGIVSAREIAGFDWWGTQLVVLSACETGVGAMPSGEGIYGLRRALVLAGARSQVVSLWNVSDSSAPVLMRDFYSELARGTGRAEALRRAKLRMLRHPRFAHPYYWAAFVSAGDWTPLDEDTMHRREPTR